MFMNNSRILAAVLTLPATSLMGAATGNEEMAFAPNVDVDTGAIQNAPIQQEGASSHSHQQESLCRICFRSGVRLLH